MLVIEPVETYVYAYSIYRTVAYTECQISRNITSNLLAILIFAYSLFERCVEEAIGEYADGKKIAGDIPAYLALGVGYSPVNAVRVNVGFHWFDDKHATSYNNRQEKLKRGTLEYNAGVEVDVNKKITLSTGWQNTNYGLSDESWTTNHSLLVPTLQLSVVFTTSTRRWI